MNVAINEVERWVAHGASHTFEHGVAGEMVIGMQQTHHIARRHCDALVDSFKHAVVAIDHIFQPSTKSRNPRLDNRPSVVGAVAIDDYIFNVGVGLVVNTSNGVFDSGGLVFGSRNQAYFHHTIMISSLILENSVCKNTIKKSYSLKICHITQKLSRKFCAIIRKSLI